MDLIDSTVRFMERVVSLTQILDQRKYFDFPYADEEYEPEVFYYTDAINDHATRFINEHRE